MKFHSILLLALMFLCHGANPCIAIEKKDGDQPNILIILVDDLGFSDIGCFGSEIETPVLDRLADQGVRFTQFYNTAKCHSTRISLLTGRYAFQAGDTKLTRASTIAEMLHDNGYFTAMAGKWHLDKQPTDFGFDRYFGHLSGATNYYTGDNTFRLNGEEFKVPEKDFYTTVANVDYAIKFLKEAEPTGKPWFLYLAFNAPHAPLQPLKEDYEKYLGRYNKGWDALYAERTSKQKKLGLFDASMELPGRPQHLPAWNDLPAPQVEWENRRMAAIAGMIDRVDQEIGRLVNHIRSTGELDNTLILFLSDNGACPYDRRTVGRDKEPYDASVRWSDSTGWAWARNAPFRFYKQNQFEGGICTSAIMHWPRGLGMRPGSINSTPIHVVDVLPTIAEITGSLIPQTWPGRELEPPAGISVAPVIYGRDMEQRPPIHFLFSNDRAIRQGDWKLVSFSRNAWELYNIANDRTELHNLIDEYPEKAQELERLWYDMAENVVLAPEKSRLPVFTEERPHVHPQWSDYLTDPNSSAYTNSRSNRNR